MRATVQVQGSLLRPQREAAGKWGGTGSKVLSAAPSALAALAGRDGSCYGEGQKRRPARHICRRGASAEQRRLAAHPLGDD